MVRGESWSTRAISLVVKPFLRLTKHSCSRLEILKACSGETEMPTLPNCAKALETVSAILMAGLFMGIDAPKIPIILLALSRKGPFKLRRTLLVVTLAKVD